jgi:hypothetical protein
MDCLYRIPIFVRVLNSRFADRALNYFAVLQANLNPVFNETFEFMATKHATTVELKVYDIDTATSDFIGQAALPLVCLPLDGGVYSVTMPLYDKVSIIVAALLHSLPTPPPLPPIHTLDTHIYTPHIRYSLSSFPVHRSRHSPSHLRAGHDSSTTTWTLHWEQ